MAFFFFESESRTGVGSDGGKLNGFRDGDIIGAVGATYLHEISQLLWHFLKWVTYSPNKDSKAMHILYS